MIPGDSQTVAGYEFRFRGVDPVAGPNFDADQATFDVYRKGELLTTLTPQKRRYRASGQVMTEASIDPGLFRDLFVAMGEPVGDQAWAIRLQYKPMIRWIWFGALLIGLGGLTTALDRRYRAVRREASTGGLASGLASDV